MQSNVLRQRDFVKAVGILAEHNRDMHSGSLQQSMYVCGRDSSRRRRRCRRRCRDANREQRYGRSIEFLDWMLKTTCVKDHKGSLLRDITCQPEITSSRVSRGTNVAPCRHCCRTALAMEKHCSGKLQYPENQKKKRERVREGQRAFRLFSSVISICSYICIQISIT